MSIMAWGSSEASIVPLAGKNKVDGFLARQGIGMAEEMKRCQSPVYAIETQVLGQPVLQLILALLSPSTDCP
jgi:hypothetical protein